MTNEAHENEASAASAEGKARYIMIGGFLGAGKTTAIASLAKALTDRGMRVGLISNDQSTGLVDTAMLRSKGFVVEEIAGGCFCCRFNSLVDAASRLTDNTRPDVFIAEPVGSCTDLVATVSYPLRRIYGSRFTIAPLSVVVDPKRAGRIYGLLDGRPFSEKVVYVYKKQLEEAQILVINKCDSIPDEIREALVVRLGEEYPRAEIFCCSAKENRGLEPWFDRILVEECGGGPSMEIDYQRYAEGEALLGWLNGTLTFESREAFDANEALLEFTRGLRSRLVAEEIEIAHLKMTLDAGEPGGSLSVVSLVRSDDEPELRDALLDEVESGHVILNLRAEADPERLRRAVQGTVTEMSAKKSDSEARLSIVVQHLESFSPGKPEPTHRFRSSEAMASG